MSLSRPSSLLIGLLVGTQLFGPMALWAAEQRGMRITANRLVVVSALSGDQLTVQNSGGVKALQFLEGVAVGDWVTTGDRTMAEVLIGNRAVVTLGPNTVAQFTTVSADQTTLQVSKGMIRVAAAASALGEQGRVTVQTPTGQVNTRGGIVRVLVEKPSGSAEQAPTGEAQPYLASYAPNAMVAALSVRGEVIQVEEGAAEILGAGPGAKAVTVQAGQAVALQVGQVGPVAGFTIQDNLRLGVVATIGHSQTPKEGLDNLVVLQVDQAAQLGRALTGAAETGGGVASSKDEAKNTINGATGGVILPNANPSSTYSVVNQLFPNQTVATQEIPGAGLIGRNNVTLTPMGSNIVVRVNGTSGLLIFSKSIPGQFTLGAVEEFKVAKELVLVGGTPNDGHGGIAPDKRLIVVMNTPQNVPTVFQPGTQRYADIGTLIVDDPGLGFFGGTLGQFSSSPNACPDCPFFNFNTGSLVHGAITATGAGVILNGGVTLDRGMKATIGPTTATSNYYTPFLFNSSSALPQGAALFNGSLLSVIKGPNGFTKLTMMDRMLGVYDGSKIAMTAEGGINSNKALLSVLDARLIGPGAVPLIDIDPATKEDKQTPGGRPSVEVTSAVVTRSTVQLDGALLTASAPLLALTKADMTTTSHFADLAGNKNQSLVLGDMLVALRAANLTINGNLVNLNSATATLNGYLFSLTDSSSLTINVGGLFHLTNGSSLNLSSKAFGVFGSGTNTLSITNNLCGGGAACGLLVNAANTPLTLLNGSPIRVAGSSQNLVLPNNFNVFAVAQNAPTPTVTLSPNAALFKIDGTSALTINGTKVR